MLVHWAGGGARRVVVVVGGGGWHSPEIEVLHENIRMENRFTVQASFIIAPKEPRLVCSI